MLISVQNNESCHNGLDIWIINEQRDKNYVYISIPLFARKKTGVGKESENKQNYLWKYNSYDNCRL
jgi:hypothetical protein